MGMPLMFGRNISSGVSDELYPMRLCIGTVQFGIDYGINGVPRTSPDDAIAMLDYATKNGVNAIDTASAYGVAEEVVGRFLSRKTMPRDAIQIISKFGMQIFDGVAASDYSCVLQSAVEMSIGRLQSDYLDAFICHVPSAVNNEAVVSAMAAVKDSGAVRHVGFSLYETDDAKKAFDSDIVDFIQVPFSVLDQRMKHSGVLDGAVSHCVDVHARSAFVQGLMLMPIESIPPNLKAARPYIAKLEALCRESGLSRRALALAYVKTGRGISHLVFGAHRMTQLKEVIEDFNRNVSTNVVEEIAMHFSTIQPDIFMPNKWKGLTK